MTAAAISFAAAARRNDRYRQRLAARSAALLKDDRRRWNLPALIPVIDRERRCFSRPPCRLRTTVAFAGRPRTCPQADDDLRPCCGRCDEANGPEHIVRPLCRDARPVFRDLLAVLVLRDQVLPPSRGLTAPKADVIPVPIGGAVPDWHRHLFEQTDLAAPSILSIPAVIFRQLTPCRFSVRSVVGGGG